MKSEVGKDTLSGTALLREEHLQPVITKAKKPKQAR